MSLLLLSYILISTIVRAEPDQSLSDKIDYLILTSSFFFQKIAEFKEPRASSPDYFDFLRRKVLYPYNLLLELHKLPKVREISEIDPDVFKLHKSSSISAWKEKEEERWLKYNISTKAKQIQSLVLFFNLVKEQQNTLDDKKNLIYSYNFIRSLLGEGEILSSSHIDYSWVDEVKKAVTPFVFMEGLQYQMPRDSDLKLSSIIQDILGFKNDLRVFNYGARNAAATHLDNDPVIALCNTPDLDEALAIAYHEFGHIVHKDSIKTYSDFLRDSEFSSDLKKIEEYTKVGMKAYNDSTHIGAYFRKNLANLSWNDNERNPFWHTWDPNGNKEQYENFAFKRGQEQRADLFALRELFKQKKISTILNNISRYTEGNYIVSNFDGDVHPSDFERALYMSGFLISQGVDINLAFKNYENHGVCLDMEKEYAKNPFFKEKTLKKGEFSFLRSYQKWSNEKDAEFKIWKQNWTAKNETKYPLELQSTLIRFHRNVKELLPRDEYIEKLLLFSYNYFCEINSHQKAHEFGQMNYKWFNEESLSVFYKEKEEEWKKKGIKEDSAKQADLVWWVEYILNEKDRTKACDQMALDHYNMLIGGSFIVDDIGKIDHQKLNEKSYDVWKKEKNRFWKKYGDRSYAEQIKDLYTTVESSLKNVGRRSVFSDKQDALHAYNYLREMKSLPLIKNIEDMDQNWLESIIK